MRKNINSTIVIAKEKISAGFLYFFPSNISGGIYFGVPTSFVNVKFVINEFIFLDDPKSVNFAFTGTLSSKDTIKKLSGLISLCKIPFECKYSIPFDISIPIFIFNFSVNWIFFFFVD